MLQDSPSLRREVDGMITEQLPAAAKLASADLGRHGESTNAIRARLEKVGYTAEQVLGDWFPEAPG